MPCLSGVNVDVFQYHITIEREGIDQCTRHVRNVNESRTRLCTRRGIIDIYQPRTEIEDANVCADLARMIAQAFRVAEQTEL